MENKSRGITLIALVVTIIVLLILAGISINMLMGQNGILNKATTAKKQTENTNARDELALAITSLGMDYHINGQGGTFRDYIFSHEADLKKELGSDDVTLNKTENTITYKGKIFTVNEDGSIEAADGIDNTKKPNTEYKNRTIEENYNDISKLAEKILEYKPDFNIEDYKTVFDKAVEMGLATTYTEADEIKEMGKDDSGNDVVKAEAMIVPIVEPSMVYYKFECKNEEQKPGGVINMAFSLNYEITFDGKKYYDSRRPAFNKPGGDTEIAYAWLGQDWVDKGYTMFSARASQYPDVSISRFEQIYHFTVQVVTENSIKKAMKALNLD